MQVIAVAVVNVLRGVANLCHEVGQRVQLLLHRVDLLSQQLVFVGLLPIAVVLVGGPEPGGRCRFRGVSESRGLCDVPYDYTYAGKLDSTVPEP